MTTHDYRADSDMTMSLSFYVFDNLRSQQDREGGHVYRYDTPPEASALYQFIRTEHPNWMVALGASINGTSEIDLVQRINGADCLINDYKQLDTWKDNPDVLRAIQETATRLKIDWQMDRSILDSPILIPYASSEQPLNPYMEDRSLRPSNPNKPVTAIQEAFVEGEGWLSPNELRRASKTYEQEHHRCPKVSKVNVAYKTAHGRGGYVDITPSDFQHMKATYLEAIQEKEASKESGQDIKAENTRAESPEPVATEKPTFDYHPSYGGTEKVELSIDAYAEDTNLYVGLISVDADGNREPFTDATVNVSWLPYLEAAIDTNNNGLEMTDFLKENGLAEFTGHTLPSGFCAYPVFRFNEAALEKADPHYFREYQRLCGVEPKEIAADAKKDQSLDALKHQAKERAAEKNAEHPKPSNSRKLPEMER